MCVRFLGLWALSVLMAGAIYAQPICAFRTGRNATLLVPADALQGTDVRPGDLLLAFTPEGRCAGQIRWEGHSTALTLWADDPMTPEKEGFAVGDSLRLMRWRRGAPLLPLQLMLATDRAYWISVARYIPDGLYRVRRLVAGF